VRRPGRARRLLPRRPPPRVRLRRLQVMKLHAPSGLRHRWALVFLLRLLLPRFRFYLLR
jgi:hypothetical protein